MKIYRWMSVAGVVAFWLAGVGCGREEVTVQRVAKQEPPPQPAATMPAGHDGMGMGAAMPRPKWNLPEGWEEQPASGMSVARFKVPGAGGLDADVAVLAIPGMGGIDLDTLNLNIFRERLLQLEPLDEAGLKASAKPVSMGAGEGMLYDMTNPSATNGAVRMLVGVLAQGGGSWYFRFTGAPATVEQQMPAYLAFLKSVTLEAAPGGSVAGAKTPEMPAGHPPIAPTAPAAAAAPAATAAGAPVAKAGLPAWEVPAGWVQGAASPMVLARFLVGGGDSKTEVTVSSFPGDVGGLVANINRWRVQMGLEPLAEAEARKEAEPVDVGGTQAMLVSIAGKRAGQPARLIGLILPKDGQTWFYKMVGDDAVAKAEKDHLVALARSAH